MKYITVATALMVSLLSLAGCSGGGSGKEIASVAAADSDALYPVEVAEIGPSSNIVYVADGEGADVDTLSIPPRRFYDLESAIAHMEGSEQAEEYAHGILPRMFNENMAFADRLLNSEYPYFLIADKQSLRLAVFDRYGVLQCSYPMSCAANYGNKHRRSDRRTPEGFFYVLGAFSTDDGDVVLRIRTDSGATVEVVGNHDTHPGRRATAGNLELMPADVVALTQYITPGTPFIVSPGERDAAINRAEGYDIQPVSIGMPAAEKRRNFAVEISDSYPAKPLSIDTSTVEIEPVDTTFLEMKMMPDSVAE